MSMKYTNSIGTKLDWRQRQLWGYVCEYKGTKSAEYIRRLVLLEIDRVTSDNRFKKWLKEKEREAAKSES